MKVLISDCSYNESYFSLYLSILSIDFATFYYMFDTPIVMSSSNPEKEGKPVVVGADSKVGKRRGVASPCP